ncbi:AroB 3-dehydroquinate synthetase [actinobacterium SCGC AAA044-D11]
MKPISITAERDYDVIFDRSWVRELEKISESFDKTLVLIPKSLYQLFGISKIELSKIRFLQTPEGEAAKTQDYLQTVWKECGNYGLTRSDCIVGLGGGSTTDLAGFAAATWLRGINWHAIPTSLAGMVDAAIGGKTGINSEHGKNLIGAFHSPNSVIVDFTFLETLSDRDFNAGMAEVLKAGFIVDPKILELALEAKANLQELIWRSIKVKADVVSSDFKESKLREILNYGHTLGHAIEANENYELRHGEAVAIGLVFAAELSNVTGNLTGEEVAKHRELLTKFNLPISYRAGEFQKLIDLMAGDKKSRGKKVRFIGLGEVGKVIWMESVTSDQLKLAYERISS